ncbi:MAG TPA: serpin family protein [Clostridia bacterium]|nr:serpin family protein [Clostridia bacterium]
MKTTHDQKISQRHSRRILKIAAIAMGLVVFSIPLLGCAIPGHVQADTLATPGKIKEGVQYEDVSDAFRQSLWEFAGKTTGAALAVQTGKNSLYSPTSLYYALAMLEAGAANKTKTDLRSFMEIPESLQIGGELRDLYALMTLDAERAAEQVANAIWFREDLLSDSQKWIKQEWLDQLSNDFYASAFSVDFSNPESSKRMSRWVEEQTKGKIKPDIDVSDPLLLIVLMNTLYFKADWVMPFSRDLISQKSFHGLTGEIKDVDYLQGTFRSLEALTSDRFQACALPLANGQIDFVLPKAGISPEELLNDPALLLTLKDGEREGFDVDFLLPKFSYRTKIDILKSMDKLGLKSVLADRPDFSAMFNLDAEVSAITQETFIALDENGLEAAAYTEIQMGFGSMPDQLERIEMTLDRPFIYVISDDAGAPLFVGIVNNPLAG